MAAREKRYGKLIRRLAFMLVGLMATSVILTSILTTENTLITHSESEVSRLTQIGEYAAMSCQNEGSGYESKVTGVWNSSVDELRSTSGNTFSSYTALFDAEFDRYAELVDRYNDEELRAKNGEVIENPVSDEEVIAEENLASHMKDILTYYRAVDFFDRLKTTFDVSTLSVFIPDPNNHTITYLWDAADQEDAHGGAHQFGDVEERDENSYSALWTVYASGQKSSVDNNASLGESVDGSMQFVYVPLKMTNNDTWMVEVGTSTESFSSAIIKQITDAMFISIVVLAICIIGLIIALYITVVRPIGRLSNRVHEYTDSKSPSVAEAIRSEKYPHDEMGLLANSTAEMIDELTDYVDNIRALSEERERVRGELAVASRIQVSALPAVRDPFLGRDDFGLSASMKPAKAVGGDFYDFFLVDATHIAVVIADVSDKGVPAALFMMRAKATIKQFLVAGLAPAEAMARANDELCRDNDGGMFVTVWFGILDLTSGELTYSCGGHNPPVYRHADGSVSWIRGRSGLILGSFEGMSYKTLRLLMKPGDLLLLYTDGVTEAMDTNKVCYGESRLESVIADLNTTVPEEVTAAVLKSVYDYSEGADQADDITMLVLRYTGPQAQ